VKPPLGVKFEDTVLYERERGSKARNYEYQKRTRVASLKTSPSVAFSVAWLGNRGALVMSAIESWHIVCDDRVEVEDEVNNTLSVSGACPLVACGEYCTSQDITDSEEAFTSLT
jgi:hypothetical protein